ncbi:MAG TPA: hypothetical protein PKN04_17000, partial [bacterium]|nr:hypothetical protein [bacterium]
MFSIVARIFHIIEITIFINLNQTVLLESRANKRKKSSMQSALGNDGLQCIKNHFLALNLDKFAKIDYDKSKYFTVSALQSFVSLYRFSVANKL